MKNNNVKKIAGRTKLFSAIGMFTVSAVMLASSTYAWFTMNKDVKVTGMEVKAKAEKGLLVNEVAAANSNTWDEVAISGDSAFTQLFPTSTYNSSTWWHANSKKSNAEAGAVVGDGGAVSVDSNTVLISEGNYYSSLAVGDPIKLETTNKNGTGNTNAEKVILYKDGVGANTGYDDGEGYYVMYKYYLKSSGSDNLVLNPATSGGQNLGIKVTAAAATPEDGTASTNLNKALRVGVKINSKFYNFAPFATDADVSYNVTKNVGGTQYDSTTAYKANTTQYAAVTIPKISGNESGNGIEADVYIWFEGEDVNCKSDNITATLDNLTVDVQFSLVDNTSGMTDTGVAIS